MTAAVRYPLTNLDVDDNAPYVDAAVVSKSDTVDLTYISRAIYVGGAGDVTVQLNGTAYTFKAVPVGTILPVKTNRVMSTGTSATDMLALY